MRWVALVLVLVLGACGDNIEVAFDAAIPVDARRWFDADLTACGADADAGCESALLRPVCDPERGVCVECAADADCTGRADSFGPHCDRGAGTCVCRSPDECRENPNGPSCDPVVRACTCIDDGDCEEPATCELEPYLGALIRTCQSIAARGQLQWRRIPSAHAPADRVLLLDRHP